MVIAVAGQPVFTPEELVAGDPQPAGPGVRRSPSSATASRSRCTVTPDAVKEKAPTGEERRGRPDPGRHRAPRRSGSSRTTPLTAAGYGTVKTWDMTVLTVKGLWKLVSRQIDSSNIGGPIQIATEAGRQAKEGMASLALFTAIISVNLARAEPAARCPCSTAATCSSSSIEGVLGRPLSSRKREMAQQVGFVLLMLLMVYALYNDLVRIDAFKFFR